MSVTPNLGYFATYAALVAAFPPSSTQTGATAYAADVGALVVNNGTSWVVQNSSYISGNGVIGLTAQNTIHLRAGLGRIRQNSGTFMIALVGDSTTAGFWSNGTQGTNCVVTSYSNVLAKILTGMGIPAQKDSFFGNANDEAAAGVSYPTFNPLVTSLGSWVETNYATLTLGGFPFYSTTNANTFSFAPVSAFDTIDVFTFNASGHGSVTVNVDGGSSLATINTGTGNGYVKTTITGVTLGTHTINVVSTSSTIVTLCGIAVRASGTSRAEIYNMGMAGATAATLTSNTGFATYPVVAIPTVAPDVTFINLTINDINTQPTSIATYSANLQAMITAAQQSGDCILMIGTPCNAAGWTGAAPTVASQYQAAVYSLAASNQLPLIDLTQRFVSYAVTNPVMPYGDAGVNSLHPGETVHGDIGRALSVLFE